MRSDAQVPFAGAFIDTVFADAAVAWRLPRDHLMSQKTVQFVIGWLLTDEELRRRFVERPRETLGEVRDQGYELSMDELDALARSDPGIWPSMARRIHPRLQRCPLK